MFSDHFLPQKRSLVIEKQYLMNWRDDSRMYALRDHCFLSLRSLVSGERSVSGSKPSACHSIQSRSRQA
ncbi:MAG: hypothetical protein LH702_28470 [Phormidesmis sp. CAN_BIN44]|nr:hypothetical protein [Phormidesmis sp. CAN_BIN44]